MVVLRGGAGDPAVEQALRSAVHRCTSLITSPPPVRPYSSPMPRVLGGVLGGWAFSYERGTPVLQKLRDARWRPDFF